MLRTLLIRNGLSFPGNKPYSYRYLRQMSTLGTSAGEQKASVNNDTIDNKTLVIAFVPGDVYKAQNDFLAPYLAQQRLSVSKDTVHREAGLIVFFPGIPGCGKHSLCKELINAPGCLGDSRPIDCLTDDFTMKDEYWDKVTSERIRNPHSILLADKSIEPDGEVWDKIEDICHHTRASAIPVVPDSIGTDSNAFCLDALAVFMFRVLQRVNHPGNLDNDSPNAGYKMLKYYHHYYYYEGRKSFEYQLLDHFGSFVKMPLLKDDRSPLPADVRSVLEEGINLYKLEKEREGRWDYTKELYAEEWTKWEKELRETLLSNADYFNSVQVSFKSAVEQVVEQLSLIAKGTSELAPSNSLRCYGNLGAVDLDLQDEEIQSVLDNLAAKDPKAGAYLKDREMQSQSIVLAVRRFHGLAAVARFGLYRRGSVIDVKLTALLFDDNMAALEVQLSADGENIKSSFPWTHSIVWSKERATHSQTNTDILPELLAVGKATRIEINPPATVSAKLKFRDFDPTSYFTSQFETFVKDLMLKEESSNKND